MSKKYRWVCVLLALVVALTLALAGCKDDNQDVQVDDEGNIIPGGKVTNVTFWTNGDDNEIAVFKTIVDKFNQEYSGVIKVTLVNHANGYETSLEQALNGRSGPDVFYVADKPFKHFAESGYLLDITDRLADDDAYTTEKMWTNAVNRYLYDVDTGLSGTADGSYYGVPKDIGPTVIFYNETYFNAAGITVISVAAEDLAEFNAGTKADDRGNLNSVYGLSGKTVKEKGFFEIDGKYYFNNQVPMSWQETVDCSNLVQEWMRSPSGGNNKNGYGYFTEWWFNYGWTVGGNVIQQVPTTDSSYKGYFWDFTLMDESPNYIVADDCNEVVVNGTTYHAGEIIAYTDKLDMSTYAKNSTEALQKRNTYNVSSEVQGLVAEGKLNELPSQKEAFTEFVRLGSATNVDVDGFGAMGYDITPSPSSLGSDAAKTSAFMLGQVAMLVDGRWNVTNFRKQMGETEADAANNKYYFKWDVAPLPMYKEYNEQGDITVHGVEAGHSGSVALCINAKSKVSEAAWLFLKFCASVEGQSLQAEAGFAIPLSRELAATEVFLQSDKFPYNSKIFLKAAEVEQAGDWWFLPTSEWIDDWANALNGQVRNGNMSMTRFYESSDYTKTFAKLDQYCKR